MKELDLTTVERIERFIVFEGAVELLHWEDTSQWGFKIKLRLESRAELDHFDKTMKRSKKRGGQRYHCIFYEGIDGQAEAQFCGRGWAETQGAHIALHIPDLDAQLWFRGYKTRDQGEKEIAGQQFSLILMEIDDNEQIIDQTGREKVEIQLGGPKSKAVARLIRDRDFNEWLRGKSVWAIQVPAGADDNVIDRFVKKICGIKSKVEFDHGNTTAWALWERQFHTPFIQWLKNK